MIGALGIGGGEDPGAGRHGSAESGPGDEDADDLVVEQFALIKKLARRPAPAALHRPAGGLRDRLPQPLRRWRPAGRRAAARR
ncbi:hypothetical protein GCM10020229_67360 [Kitasatospora albolonga]